MQFIPNYRNTKNFESEIETVFIMSMDQFHTGFTYIYSNEYFKSIRDF
jgi:hypothetical protein